MKPKEKAEKLATAIAELRLMTITAADSETVIQAAERIAQLQRFDSENLYINIFHNGTRKTPWMFEIRRNGMLRGAFEGIENGYDTREEAETQAFEVADSMLDGTFEIRFTS